MKNEIDLTDQRIHKINYNLFGFKNIGFDTMDNILVIANNMTQHLSKTFKEQNNESKKISNIEMALYIQNVV